jgi:hypothetical protein
MWRGLMGPPERPLAVVPRWLFVMFAAVLALHAGVRVLEPRPMARAEALGVPWPATVWRVLSLDEPIAVAQWLVLYLQAFDNQPGVSIPFRALDYARVTDWLKIPLALDPAGQYPLLLASQVYAQVNDAAKQRQMCEFVSREFIDRPNARWRWLAHCSIMAKHRLKDMPLALRYAEDITRHARGASNWARQMRIFILEDMGEIDSATVLLGGLLAGNEIGDEKERNFLTERLRTLRDVEKSTKASKSRQSDQ